MMMTEDVRLATLRASKLAADLSEDEYQKLRQEYGASLKGKMGAEAIRDVIRMVDL
jgi:hypothetical protein